jgi:hypothetical protein
LNAPRKSIGNKCFSNGENKEKFFESKKHKKGRSKERSREFCLVFNVIKVEQ